MDEEAYLFYLASKDKARSTECKLQRGKFMFDIKKTSYQLMPFKMEQEGRRQWVPQTEEFHVKIRWLFLGHNTDEVSFLQAPAGLNGL